MVDASNRRDINEFMSVTDADGLRRATFSISPTSRRFQSLCGGHIMASEALAPASLFFEMAARAALFLQRDTQTATWLPCVDNLKLEGPIGGNENSLIQLRLEQVESLPWSWTHG